MALKACQNVAGSIGWKLNMNDPKYYLTDSRWIWFLRGLPSPARARALFLTRTATMTTLRRSKGLWDLSQNILLRNVPGAFVECGVWRGGSAGIMGLAMKSFDAKRPLHLFDSFEGLPEPGPQDGTAAVEYSGGRSGGHLASIAKCDATLDLVRTLLFERLQLDPKKVHFHVGWFQETVPVAAKELGPISILRLDGDWYESTRVCLEHLYPKVSSGGVVILDDYNGWEGSRKATDEYRERNNITAPLVQMDPVCSYWFKP